MTPEEINKIRFKLLSHVAMANEHVCSYIAVDVPFELRMCSHTPVDNYETGELAYGRAYRHYMLNGVVYNTRKKLYEAMKEL